MGDASRAVVRNVPLLVDCPLRPPTLAPSAAPSSLLPQAHGFVGAALSSNVIHFTKASETSLLAGTVRVETQADEGMRWQRSGAWHPSPQLRLPAPS